MGSSESTASGQPPKLLHYYCGNFIKLYEECERTHGKNSPECKVHQKILKEYDCRVTFANNGSTAKECNAAAKPRHEPSPHLKQPSKLCEAYCDLYKECVASNGKDFPLCMEYHDKMVKHGCHVKS